MLEFLRFSRFLRDISQKLCTFAIAWEIPGGRLAVITNWNLEKRSWGGKEQERLRYIVSSLSDDILWA